MSIIFQLALIALVLFSFDGGGCSRRLRVSPKLVSIQAFTVLGVRYLGHSGSLGGYFEFLCYLV
jgi:hypothetical protein